MGFSIWDSAIPFAVPLISTLKSEAKKQNIELLLRSAQFDASVQASDLDQLVVQGVDVICATPVDPKALLPAAKSAESRGVPVVAIGGTMEGFPYIGADDTEFGKQMGKLIVEALKDTPGPKKIALLRGAAGASPDRLRRKAIGQVLADHPDIEIIAEQATDWSPEKGLSITQAWLQKYGKDELQLIHGFGSGVEVPAAKWAKTSAGREQLIFTGGELTKQTKTAIKKGWEYGVVIQSPTELGKVVMQTIPTMKPDFNKVPASADIPLPICTKDNLDQFKAF